MNLILFDDDARADLLPFTFTRPVCDIRIGILTIREKWEHVLDVKSSTLTQDYLSGKFPLAFAIDDDNLWVNGSVCPNKELIKEIDRLNPGEALVSGTILIAYNSGKERRAGTHADDEFKKGKTCYESHAKAFRVQHVWDIFSENGTAIQDDFKRITKGRNSRALSRTNQVIGVENIFVEEGAKVECAILNASTGPVYIGKDAEIMEGSIVRGPFALCEHSTLKLGAKVYGPSTVGPHSKVGGELNNSVIFGFSNKAHDGFLGNSVIGEWCNLGADTNNSNLKNNYAEVKLWNDAKEKFVNTGLQFCGLMMGDHSKCGINTMFNTGTVVGVSANIFGSGFPRNFIPSFSWGGASGFTVFRLNDAFEVAQRVMERRAVPFTDEDKNILSHVFEVTERFRK